MEKLYYKKVNHHIITICPFNQKHVTTTMRIGSVICVRICGHYINNNPQEMWIHCKLHNIKTRKNKLKKLMGK